MSGRRGSDLVCEVGLTPDQTVMLEANLGLIGYLIEREARHLVGDTYSSADAFQDGVFGLARAVQKFDPTRGWRFSTYAMPHIFQSIQRGRGRCESREWRRAYGNNQPDEYVRPLSLDHPLHTEHGSHMGIADLMPAPVDTETDVTSDLVSSALAEGLRAQARDAIERDLVEALICHAEDDRPVRYPVIGARYGMSAEGARRRLRLLIERYRESVA